MAGLPAVTVDVSTLISLTVLGLLVGVVRGPVRRRVQRALSGDRHGTTRGLLEALVTVVVTWLLVGTVGTVLAALWLAPTRPFDGFWLALVVAPLALLDVPIPSLDDRRDPGEPS